LSSSRPPAPRHIGLGSLLLDPLGDAPLAAPVQGHFGGIKQGVLVDDAAVLDHLVGRGSDYCLGAFSGPLFHAASLSIKAIDA
jgi:hypothetical protein